MTLEKAKAVAKATEWSGDTVVNFMTCHNAARVLLREVERLEQLVEFWSEGLEKLIQHGTH